MPHHPSTLPLILQCVLGFTLCLPAIQAEDQLNLLPIVPSGLSDVDRIRVEVRSSPTTAENFHDRLGALGRWWRLLWRQGYDLDEFSRMANRLTYRSSSPERIKMEGSKELVDEAFELLNRVQATASKIPEVRGTPQQSPTTTNWPAHKSIDGTNSGFSPDTGPSHGEIVWRFPKKTNWTAKPVLAGDRIYLPSPGADVVGFCLDAATGTIHWRARQHAFRGYHSWGSKWDPIVQDDRVQFRVGSLGLDSVSVDRQTGERLNKTSATDSKDSQPQYFAHTMTRNADPIGAIGFRNLADWTFHWRFPMQGQASGEPVTVGQITYAADQTGMVYAFDPYNETTHWSANLSARLVGKPHVLEQSLFIGSQDGQLFSVNLESGTKNWTWKCPTKESHAFQFFSTPVTHNKRLYVGTASGYIYCLDATSGTELWNFKIGSWIRSGLFVTDDNVNVATLDGQLIGLKQTTDGAQEVWRTHLARHGFVADLVGNDQHLFVTDRHFLLHAVSLQTGHREWKHSCTDGVWTDGTFTSASYTKGLETTPIVVDGMMYISGPDGFVNAVDADSGVEQWRFEVSGMLSAGPIYAEGKVFINRRSSGEPRMCALDAKTGDLVWDTNAYGPTWISPTYNDGLLFFGNMLGTVFAVEAATGKEVWSYFTPTDTVKDQNPPEKEPYKAHGVYPHMVIDEKYVYAGAWCGYFFAFDQKTGEIRWRTQNGSYDHNGRPDSGSLMLHKNHLYVRAYGDPWGQRIAAINKDSGEFVWHHEVKRGILQNGTLAADGDRVFGSVVRDIGSLPYDATILAFHDVENGSELLWTYEGAGGLTAPVVAGNKVISPSTADPFMVALDTATGEVIWRTYVGDQALENVPAVYGNRVYSQLKNGWVVAIE